MWNGWIQPRPAGDPEVMTKIIQPTIPLDLSSVILCESIFRSYPFDVMFGPNDIDRDSSRTEDGKACMLVTEEGVTKDRMRRRIAIRDYRLQVRQIFHSSSALRA